MVIERFKDRIGKSDLLEACECAVRSYFPSVYGDSRIGAIPEQLAQSHGIEVVSAKNVSFEGMLEREGFAYRIVVRSSSSEARRRFTVAHELGHWILQQLLGPSHEPLFRGVSISDSEIREEEDVANYLAAEILLPASQLKKTVLDSSPLSAVKTLGRQFGVSRTMSVRRISDVTGMPAIALEIVPFRFDRLESTAEIDDAFYVSPMRGTLFARDRTKFIHFKSFQEIREQRSAALDLETPHGRCTAKFEFEERKFPIPGVFAVTFESNQSSQNPQQRPQFSQLKDFT